MAASERRNDRRRGAQHDDEGVLRRDRPRPRLRGGHQRQPEVAAKGVEVRATEHKSCRPSGTGRSGWVSRTEEDARIGSTPVDTCSSASNTSSTEPITRCEAAAHISDS